MYGHLRTRGASRRHMPLGMVEVGYLKARLSDRGLSPTSAISSLLGWSGDSQTQALPPLSSSRLRARSDEGHDSGAVQHQPVEASNG